MIERRTTAAELIFSFWMLLALYIVGLVGMKNHTRVFIALMTLACHILANVYCARISSYRFKSPSAKYIKIKNKFIRKLFVRPCSVGGIEFANKSDDRTNIIGLVLNIINISLLVLFEVLIFMPAIPSEPYFYTLLIRTRPRNYGRFGFELHTLNEIIPAVASMIFMLAMAIILLIFVGLFEHQIKEHRKNIAKNSAKAPRK